MRDERDGDIIPKKEDMMEAYKVLKNLLELIGEDDEHAQQLKNDMKQLENDIRESTS